jgi:hypothetical protein
MAREEPVLIPLYAFVEGDTLGLVVMAGEEEPVGALAQRLQEAASLRVRPRPSVKLIHRGRALDARCTVRQAGMEPLDRVDLVEDNR